MPISPEFLLELKSRNDIETVISSYVNLKQRGKNLIGLCPFHNEKTPSFTLYPEKGSYYCFGCGAGGDVITFIRQIENLDYVEAVRFLADRVGLQLPEDGFDDKTAKLKTQILEANREAARFFHECITLEKGKQALEYLKKRQISSKTIRHFGLGYAPEGWDSLLNHLKSKGFTQDVLLAADLVINGKTGRPYDKFRNRIIFPIIDMRGNVVGFGGRAMPGEDKSAKYVNTGDTLVFKKSKNMYGLNFAKNISSQSIILVEGNIDVIALHQAGIENAVAACGTAFTEEQARLLSRYTREVVITFDSDSAGKKATQRAISTLSSLGIKSRVLSLPDCKDPDDFIKKHGAERFRGLLDGALNDIEYTLYTTEQAFDISTDDGRLAYLKKAVEILAGSENSIVKDLYAGKLATKYNITKDALLLEIKSAEKKQNRNRYKKELSEIVRPTSLGKDVNPQKSRNLRAVRAEEAIISTLITHPDCFEKIITKLLPGQMITDFSNKVYSAICRIFKQGQVFDLSLLAEDFTATEIGYISMLGNSFVSDNPVTIINDSIKVLDDERDKMDNSALEQLSNEQWALKMKAKADKKH